MEFSKLEITKTELEGNVKIGKSLQKKISKFQNTLDDFIMNRQEMRYKKRIKLYLY
jgi:hypothetical protein